MRIARPALAITCLAAFAPAAAQRRAVQITIDTPCAPISQKDLDETGVRTVDQAVGSLPSAPGPAASKPSCPAQTPAAAMPPPTPSTPPTPAAQPTPAAPKTPEAQKVAPQNSAPAGLDDRISEGERKLDADIKACKPINPKDYKPLLYEASNNYHLGRKASEAGVPIDAKKVTSDRNRTQALMQRAEEAAAKQSANCPPKEQPKIKEKIAADEHSSAAPVQPLNQFDQRLLDIQNGERMAFRVPPLIWNATLAQHAQDYANQLASTGNLAHASRAGRGDERENINQGIIGWGADQMMWNWLSEKQHFVAGTFPLISDTGNWYTVGHYSQIIWPTTTDVGCGTAAGRGFSWLVCRYSPGGNRDGQPVGLRANGTVRGR